MDEKVCNECGHWVFAGKNAPCLQDGCKGVLCRVVTPKIRFAGMLFRSNNLVVFRPFEGFDVRHWGKETWRELFGKLPRIGRDEAVILELPRV